MKKVLVLGILALLIACGDPAENIDADVAAGDVIDTEVQENLSEGEGYLVAAEEALLAVNTAAYTATIEGFFIDGDTLTIDGNAEVVLQKGETTEDGSIYASFEVVAADEVISGAAATDGITAYSIDSQAEAFYFGALDMGADRLMRNIPQGLVMVEYLITNEPYGAELGAESFAVLADEEINGVLCNVVEVNMHPYTSTWWFDAETNLPRANKISVVGPDGNIAMQYMLTLSDLVVDGEAPDASRFVLECPEGYSSEEYVGAVAVGAAAPLWTLPTPDGGSIALEDLRGKVVIMDFWATWCGPCRQVMPALQAIHEAHGEELVVIGVNTWEQEDPAAFMAENGYTYPIVVEVDIVAQDYFVEGIPTFYVIDQNGNVAFHAVGADPANEEALVEVLETLLAE